MFKIIVAAVPCFVHAVPDRAYTLLYYHTRIICILINCEYIMYKKVYVCECKVSSRHDISFYFLTPLGKRRGENSL